MNADNRIEFRISSMTPESIPMDRLGEYLCELAAVLSNRDKVHFKGVKKGSVLLSVEVEPPAMDAVLHRLRLVDGTDAPADLNKAVANVNRLLREDGARGALRLGSLQIARFPGCDLPLPQRFGPIKERGVLEGELVRVGGKDRTIHALLIDHEGREFKLSTTSRDMAKELAGYLYQQVSVNGVGTWFRGDDGLWVLENFNIESFEAASNISFAEAVASLRLVEGAGWKSMADPVKMLKHLRRG